VLVSLLTPFVEDTMIGRLVVASTLLVLGSVALGAPAWSAAPPRDALATATAVVPVQAGGTVTVNSKAGYANLRSEPSTHSGQVLAKVNQGTKLEVISRAGGWTQVKSGDKTGYINDKLLRK
jgi:uncharacterized protein YgiM (DUF1202 family)